VCECGGYGARLMPYQFGFVEQIVVSEGRRSLLFTHNYGGCKIDLNLK
jgi:hypothetical protein